MKYSFLTLAKDVLEKITSYYLLKVYGILQRIWDFWRSYHLRRIHQSVPLLLQYMIILKIS